MDSASKTPTMKIRVKRKSCNRPSPYNTTNTRCVSPQSLKAHLPTRKANPFTLKGNRRGPLSPLSTNVVSCNILENKGNESPLYRKLSQTDLGRNKNDTNKENAILPIESFELKVEGCMSKENDKWYKSQEQKFSDQCSDVTGSVVEQKTNIVHSDKIPIDWSLRTKLRITSSFSFSSLGKVTSLDQSKALVNFSRCNVIDSNGSSSNEGFVCDFHQNLSVWLHPSSLLLSSCSSKSNSERRALLENTTMRSILLSSWVNSFRSLFNLTRTAYCPYFYVHSSTFSGLFRTVGEQPGSVLCILTPTTKGFRKALEEEGIDFSMPLLRKDSVSEEGPSSKTAESENQRDDLQGESDDEFLKSIGLSENSFPSVKEKKIKSARAQLLLIDHRDESTIVIRDNNTMAFVNYIMGCSSFLDPTHSCSWELPVLIAPVAFEGATLQALKMTQGPTQCFQDGSSKKIFAMDISGFVLPTQFYNICTLLQRDFKEFHATVTSHRTSRALNVSVKESNDLKDESPDSQSSINFGLSNDEFTYLSTPVSDEIKQIDTFKFCNDKISCTFK